MSKFKKTKLYALYKLNFIISVYICLRILLYFESVIYIEHYYLAREVKLLSYDITKILAIIYLCLLLICIKIIFDT